MTREEAIESFKCSNEQAKLRLEVEKMRMDSGEIKELEFYIERDEMAIKALEPKTGHWIERESGTEDKENGFETVIVCSHCDFPATTFYSEDCESRTQIRTHFCPNCGAKMESEE